MLTEYFFLVFSGAALLGCLAMYGRQPLIITYIGLGMLIGPFGLGLIEDVPLLNDASEIGIIFLLFLLGLDMQPSALLCSSIDSFNAFYTVSAFPVTHSAMSRVHGTTNSEGSQERIASAVFDFVRISLAVSMADALFDKLPLAPASLYAFMSSTLSLADLLVKDR